MCPKLLFASFPDCSNNATGLLALISFPNKPRVTPYPRRLRSPAAYEASLG